MLGDDDLRARLARRALAEARERYAWPVVAQQVQAVYERVRGTTPDPHWALPAGRPPCRFRDAPHLL